jgi:hypothetical protein
MVTPARCTVRMYRYRTWYTTVPVPVRRAMFDQISHLFLLFGSQIQKARFVPYCFIITVYYYNLFSILVRFEVLGTFLCSRK